MTIFDAPARPRRAKKITFFEGSDPVAVLGRGKRPFSTLLRGMEIDEKRATLRGAALLNQERRARGLEPITLEEYVAGRRQ